MHAAVPSLGHALFDRQHRRIAVLSRRLVAAAARGRCRAEMAALERATRRHFASEERLMAAHRYPGRRGHRELHDGVLADMRKMRLRLRSGASLHGKHIEQVLNWLTHHADEADRNLVVFLAKRR